MHKPNRPRAPRPARILSLWSPLILALGAPLAAQSNYATPYAFAALAGTVGQAGSANGAGAAALFNQPCGLAVDSNGNLFVADRANDAIREIAVSGQVTTVAGTPGSLGTSDGTGPSALFNEPAGLAAGSGGTIYVADTNNNTIRKIASGGVVTTFAGQAGKAGSTDATGTSALLNEPFGIAVDGSGNLYVTELGNHTVRMVTQASVVTTLAGTAGSIGSADGTGASARFNQPAGIAVDASGNLYVADSGSNTIRKIAAGGVVTTLAGSPGVAGFADGTGASARFSNPRGLALDGSGNLFVADTGNSTIRRITPAGAVTTLAGSPGQFGSAPGAGAAALFDVPVGIAVDSTGNVFVSNELADTIEKGSQATAIAPVITRQPTSQTIPDGSTVVFSAAASGLPAPTYQWYFAGRPLAAGAGVSGVAGPTLVISGATASDAGSYYCLASNASGSAQSGPAALAVSATSDVGRLINISCRAQVGTGSDILICGFVVGGADMAGAEPLLIRASGPALVPFGVTGTLPDPELRLFSGSTLLESNGGWGGGSALSDAAASVGAFAWTNPASHDSALLEKLPAGPYTAQVSGASGDTGVALAEVYDATPSASFSPASPRLVNISTRVQVGTGASVLIAGFVVGGSTSRTFLIRASGPALIPFGVTGTLPDPELQLFSGSTLLESNTAWGGSAAIADAAAAVGAFAWGDPASADSAILATLPPGAYTAQVSGATGDTGVALVEIYEVP